MAKGVNIHARLLRELGPSLSVPDPDHNYPGPNPEAYWALNTWARFREAAKKVIFLVVRPLRP